MHSNYKVEKKKKKMVGSAGVDWWNYLWSHQSTDTSQKQLLLSLKKKLQWSKNLPSFSFLDIFFFYLIDFILLKHIFYYFFSKYSFKWICFTITFGTEAEFWNNYFGTIQSKSFGFDSENQYLVSVFFFLQLEAVLKFKFLLKEMLT